MQISTSVGVVQYIRFFLHSIKASNINYVTPRLQDGSAAAFYLARQAKTLPSSFAVPPATASDGSARACGASSVTLRAVIARHDAEAVVLDLMQRLAAGRQFIGFGWEARRDELGRQRMQRHGG